MSWKCNCTCWHNCYKTIIHVTSSSGQLVRQDTRNSNNICAPTLQKENPSKPAQPLVAELSIGITLSLKGCLSLYVAYGLSNVCLGLEWWLWEWLMDGHYELTCLYLYLWWQNWCWLWLQRRNNIILWFFLLSILYFTAISIGILMNAIFNCKLCKLLISFSFIAFKKMA